MVVDTGESAQSEKEDWIKKPAQPNPKHTMSNQQDFERLVLLAEIYERPWMVEDSRNSFRNSIFNLVIYFMNLGNNYIKLKIKSFIHRE